VEMDNNVHAYEKQTDNKLSLETIENTNSSDNKGAQQKEKKVTSVSINKLNILRKFIYTAIDMKDRRVFTLSNLKNR